MEHEQVTASKKQDQKRLRSVVIGVGSALPKRCVTNRELEKEVETSDEWIVQRTGITQRYIAGEGETTSTLGAAAARVALAEAGCAPGDIDLIICATSTPDLTFPSVATMIQAELGITGAMVLEAQEIAPGEPDRGVLTSQLRSDGRHRSKLYVDGGPSTTGTAGFLRMEGKEVFRFAVGQVTDVMTDAFAATGLTADDLDWFVPHQANQRIIDASAQKLHIAPEKVVKTVQWHGNTSAASIPLALAVACKDGRIKPGDLVMIEAIGGGFAWGAALIRW